MASCRERESGSKNNQGSDPFMSKGLFLFSKAIRPAGLCLVANGVKRCKCPSPNLTTWCENKIRRIYNFTILSNIPLTFTLVAKMPKP
ncbi:hypothetical protein ACOSQ4_028446 [Xanthoceras sorbifolium]